MALATEEQKRKARDFGLKNVELIAIAANEVGLPFYAACALMQKESMGRNIYGNDYLGTLSGYPYDVNHDNYRVFRWLVFTKGKRSNGVGPCQLTYKGFFTQMEKEGLKPYDPYDNMFFGFRLLLSYYKSSGSWTKAGTRYNGSSTYGRDFSKKVSAWKTRLSVD